MDKVNFSLNGNQVNLPGNQITLLWRYDQIYEQAVYSRMRSEIHQLTVFILQTVLKSNLDICIYYKCILFYSLCLETTIFCV